jgi:hypothetical protein
MAACASGIDRIGVWPVWFCYYDRDHRGSDLVSIDVENMREED